MKLFNVKINYIILAGGIFMPKQATGKAITARLSPYTFAQLERLANKKNIKKSAIITLALEKYEREEERNEGK